ncbi:MAG: malto-oligosyltrehalose synthase [Pseudomonadota bacterium]
MRIPRSTYRLQLHKDFGFRDAARAADYLARLGVSELYVSPILKATPGSTHGYDVLDHETLNPELGGEAGFAELTAAARSNGLGLTVDFVPNHMGVGCDGNPYWDDILKHGRASGFAEYFDIDWHYPKETLVGKLLLPVLPEQYGVSLEHGEIALGWDGAAVRIHVAGRKLPIRPGSLPSLLDKVADLVSEPQPKLAQGLRQIARRCESLLEAWQDPERTNYLVSAEAAEKQLAELLSSDERASTFAQALQELSGVPGTATSFDYLDQLLRMQVYRLSSWRLALECINYRRFFSVNELAAIRVELPRVFDSAHAKLLRLVEDGSITAIRLDHIDGLYDPIGYLTQLDAALRHATHNRDESAPLHLTVEKILAAEERLPDAFITHGTTGYEFIRVVNGIFVDRRTEQNLTSLYRRFTGDQLSFGAHLLQAKRDILCSLLASDATKLSHELERLAEQHRRSRDLTWRSLHDALVEVMAAFGTYRSYVRPNGERTSDDEAMINRAVADALGRNPTAARGPYQFLRSLLLQSNEAVEGTPFAMRFQQTTGPVTAKSLEDTAFYRYTRFVAENEVGAQPERLGVELTEFHAQNIARASAAPLSLVTGSTHDTKRGEDVRARLAVISELPNTWRRVVFELARSAAELRSEVGGQEAPGRCDEYLFYQTLLGALPFAASAADFPALEPRLQEYMLKACREAKTNTSWLNPNLDYERALAAFISGALRSPAIASSLLRFAARIDSYGACNALSQVALKMCSPGVPDTYQGSEVWHQVLVDPDNRRPVDYHDLRARLMALDELGGDRLQLTRGLLDRFEDGSLKLFVVRELLRLRNERTELFAGAYRALDAGPNCIAFARTQGDAALICAVPRFPFRLTRGRARWPLGERWGSQLLSAPDLGGHFRNVLTAETITFASSAALSDVFGHFPVAVLLREKH